MPTATYPAFAMDYGQTIRNRVNKYEDRNTVTGATNMDPQLLALLTSGLYPPAEHQGWSLSAKG